MRPASRADRAAEHIYRQRLHDALRKAEDQLRNHLDVCVSCLEFWEAWQAGQHATRYICEVGRPLARHLWRLRRLEKRLTGP